MAQIRYFLGANSPNGFYSLYDQLIDLESAQAVYLLKGGPGCGKSSFMRRVARTPRRPAIPSSTFSVPATRTLWTPL